MDCRDPEARDGNAKYIGVFWIDEMYFLYCFSHPCVLDSGNPCRNDGAGTCVDTYALGAKARAARPTYAGQYLSGRTEALGDSFAPCVVSVCLTAAWARRVLFLYPQFFYFTGQGVAAIAQQNSGFVAFAVSKVQGGFN